MKMKNNIVTFVCGGPCSGKSTIVRFLGRRENCDVCSADHIKIAIRDYLSDEESKKANTNTYRAWQDFGYPKSDANIYRAALEHSKVFWIALEKIANTYTERGERLIMEGGFFTPEFAESFKNPAFRFIVCNPSIERHLAQAKRRNATRKRTTHNGVLNNSETMFDSGRIFHLRLVSGFEELRKFDSRIEIWNDLELDQNLDSVEKCLIAGLPTEGQSVAQQ
jgi:2-phosphoglycerate kinase